MKLSTQLIHFDAQMAVCLATIEEGEKQVSVYASARAGEAGNYADLAQQRALQLAWMLLQEGFAALQHLTIATQPPVLAKPDLPQTTAQEPGPASRDVPPISEPASLSVDTSSTVRTENHLESSSPW